MTKRRLAVMFSILAGVLVYAREWLVLFGLIPFPEASFFEGFPNLLSPVPGIALVLGFLFREYARGLDSSSHLLLRTTLSWRQLLGSLRCGRHS